MELNVMHQRGEISIQTYMELSREALCPVETVELPSTQLAPRPLSRTHVFPRFQPRLGSQAAVEELASDARSSSDDSDNDVEELEPPPRSPRRTSHKRNSPDSGHNDDDELRDFVQRFRPTDAKQPCKVKNQDTSLESIQRRKSILGSKLFP